MIVLSKKRNLCLKTIKYKSLKAQNLENTDDLLIYSFTYKNSPYKDKSEKKWTRKKRPNDKRKRGRKKRLNLYFIIFSTQIEIKVGKKHGISYE